MEILIFSVQSMQIPLVLFIIFLSAKANHVLQIDKFKYFIYGFLFNLFYLSYFLFFPDLSPHVIYPNAHNNVLISIAPYIKLNILFSLGTSFCFFIIGINQFFSNKYNKYNFKALITIIYFFICVLSYILECILKNPKNDLPGNYLSVFVDFLSLSLMLIFFYRFNIKFLGRYYVVLGFLFWAVVNLIIPIQWLFSLDDVIKLTGFSVSLIAKVLILLGIFFWYINKEKDSAIKAEREKIEKENIAKTKDLLEEILTRAFHEINLPLKNLERTINELAVNFPREHKLQLMQLENIAERIKAIIWVANNTYNRKQTISEEKNRILTISLKSNHDFKIIKINSLIEIAVHSIKQVYKGIKFDLTYGGNCYIDCIQTEIIQVFINIFKNAIEAYEENQIKNINVRSFIEKDKDSQNKNKCVVVEIEDFGSGIPEDIIDKIWQKGFSTKLISKKNINRGEGLYIIKNILLNHSGSSINVISPIVKDKDNSIISGSLFVLKFKHVIIDNESNDIK